MFPMLMLASRVKTKLKCLHSLKKSVGFKKAENFNNNKLQQKWSGNFQYNKLQEKVLLYYLYKYKH